MIAAGVAGLIASGEGIMNIAFDPISLAADGMHDRMTASSELGIFRFVALDQLQDLDSRVLFQGVGEEAIKTLCAATAVHAGLDRLGRRQGASGGTVAFLCECRGT